MKHIIYIISATAVLFSGCISYRAGDKPHVREMKSEKYEIVNEAEGESSEFYLLWFIPVTDPADILRAENNAIDGAGCDNMIDAEYTTTNKILPLGRVKIFTVRGKTIRYTPETESENKNEKKVKIRK